METRSSYGLQTERSAHLLASSEVELMETLWSNLR